MHYLRIRKHGSIEKRPLPRGVEHSQWRGDNIGYNGAHVRVRRERGNATLHLCVDCGGLALEWSYDHSDLNELIEEGKRYSADPQYYQPRCKPCHESFDGHSVGWTVYRYKRTGRTDRWYAFVTIPKPKLYLGSYLTEAAARLAVEQHLGR
jgi:hypothetical protein